MTAAKDQIILKRLDDSMELYCEALLTKNSSVDKDHLACRFKIREFRSSNKRLLNTLCFPWMDLITVKNCEFVGERDMKYKVAAYSAAVFSFYFSYADFIL